MAITLKAENRPEQTKSEIKQLRKNGRIPGVVYGKKAGNSIISIDQKDLLALLRTNPHAIIDMELPEGSKKPVMVNEIQRDKVNRELLHIDFHQINMNEPVKTAVAFHFTGDAIGAREGGIVQVQLHELEIRCLPEHIPDNLQVDISALGLGDNLLVKDLSIPPNIEVKTDLNDLVVTVLAPQKEEEAETVEAAEKADAKVEEEEPA